jgi:2-polyprenyl-6-methoxyphenol hydroxylase-like FAD-dependent oxidoreductase
MFPSETDVLIVGAGPTGLSLAATLQQAGIRHVLIDKLAEGHNTSRRVIHAPRSGPRGSGPDQPAARIKPNSGIRDRDKSPRSPFDTLAFRTPTRRCCRRTSRKSPRRS